MDTFGEQLKHERESRDVALDEIARATKIRVRYLEALEQGQHERLPGIVFAKGYVRAYAETIGADADRLVAAYVEEQRSLGRLATEASQEQVLEALAAAVNHKPGGLGAMKPILLGISALLAVGAIAWFGVRPLLDRDETTAAQPVNRAAATMTPMSETLPQKEAEVTAAPDEVVDSAPQDDPAIRTLASSAVGVSTSDGIVDEPPVVVDGDVEPEMPEIANNDATPTSTSTPIERPVEPVTTREPVVETESVVAGKQSLTVPEHGVGTGVQQRSLVGESTSFETGTQVVFWTRVLGGESGRSVHHVWSYEGSVAGSIELSIGAAHWRTYSRQTLRRSGEWTVEAVDEEGNVLARQTFVASPA